MKEHKEPRQGCGRDSRRLLAVLSSFCFLFIGTAAFAQDASGQGGFMNTIRGLVNNPAFSSYLMSKMAGTGGAASYGSGYGNSYTPAPNYYANQSSAYDNTSGASSSPKSLLLNAISRAANSGFGNRAASNQSYPSSSTDPYGLGSGSTSSGFAAPNSGFYSMEQGARLGGVGYDPSLVRPSSPPPVDYSSYNDTATAPVSFQSRAPNPSRLNALSALPGLLGSLRSSTAQAIPQSGSLFTISKKLEPAELKQLGRYDLSVLIDRSGSMTTKDCPDLFQPGQSISRWDWCREQTTLLTQQTAGALPSGITLVPFSDKWQEYFNVSPAQINSIFNAGSPSGSTNLAGALKAELDRYFQERDAGLRQRPLMITVITDGVPDSKSAVRRVIREAETHLVKPGEIRISFLLIGDDQSGEDFVDQLSSDINADEPGVNLVSRHSFVEVNQVGLPRSLVMSAQS